MNWFLNVLRSLLAIIILLLTLLFGASASAATYRVDGDNGDPTPDGTTGNSWTNAFKYLQDALLAAGGRECAPPPRIRRREPA